ncbi:hypothetical protein MINTM015_27830 [Mycobacterium paraintracellulare]|nr:hypothetical protein MINTM015_27830 [Mycobacterium paraintracellulare]
MLFAQGHPAATGPVLIGEKAVGIEAIFQDVGQAVEFVGPVIRGVAGQLGFDPLAGGWVDPAGQAAKESADHRHMGGAEFTAGLGGGGGGQHRGQGFTGQAVARAQIGGVFDPPGGLGVADPQPVGDRLIQRAAEFFDAGLAGQVIDQRMLSHRQPAARLFAAL